MLWWKKDLEHRCEVSLETCVISPPAHLSPPAQQPLLSPNRKHLAFLLEQQRETVYTEYSQPLLYTCPYHLWYIDCVIPSENIFPTSWIGALRNAYVIHYLVCLIGICKGGSSINFLIITVKAKLISTHFQQDSDKAESKYPASWRFTLWMIISDHSYDCCFGQTYWVVRSLLSISIKKVMTKKQPGCHTHTCIPQRVQLLGLRLSRTANTLVFWPPGMHIEVATNLSLAKCFKNRTVFCHTYGRYIVFY